MSLQDPGDEDKTIYKVVVNHEEQYSGPNTKRIRSVGMTLEKWVPRRSASPTLKKFGPTCGH